MLNKKSNKPKVIIVGTGPSGLMAGTQLLKRGFDVAFRDQKKAAGRKFLVAGHGGFNLSNNQSIEDFIDKYNREEVKEMVQQFQPQDLRDFLIEIGIPTYIGSTGKIFPEKGIKPIEVLNAWLNWLISNGATFSYESTLVDFNNHEVIFHTIRGEQVETFDYLILALGGKSWSITGSTGKWLELFISKGIDVGVFEASNAGMNCKLPLALQKFEGTVIKNCKITHGSFEKLGEITLTAYGLEGAPIYHCNAAWRAHPNVPILIDFKPGFSLEKIIQLIENAKNSTEGLKSLKVSKVVIEWLKNTLSKDEYTVAERLAANIKRFPVMIDELRPIDEAISTIGGVSWSALNSDGGLYLFPKVYVCGEMIDWDAPTGGYLLQACFAMGNAVGNSIDGMKQS